MACSQKVAGVFFSSVLFSSLIWRKMTALRFLRLKRDTVRLLLLRLWLWYLESDLTPLVFPKGIIQRMRLIRMRKRYKYLCRVI